jgi:mannose-6-phosphate isomerase-like protein (cupin superfamily)
MNSIRQLPAAVIIAASIMLSTNLQTALAQQAPAATPLRTVLALTTLPSVVEAPLFFRLSKIELLAGQSTNYAGPVGFMYLLSGSLDTRANSSQPSLQPGDGLLLSAGKTYSFETAGSQPAVFLHFVLARAAELDQVGEQQAAVVTELYRTPGPITHLKPGPYEFTLTRVAFPTRMPPNLPHYRSGAALYYILSGPGMFIADGKTEAKETGTPHFEPHGWIHQWANPGDTSLILLQANLSEEGVPAVIMVPRR